jgi:branched-chain amino acid transport system ATP-binding protein
VSDPLEAVAGHIGTPMLATRGLVSGYGRMQILYGVDIEAPRGRITTVIGPNGSGKSTFLKTVAGLVRTWRGSTRLDGEEIAGRPAHTLVRQGMCLVPQGRVVFPDLTVEENLRMCGYPVRSERELRQRTEQAYEFLPVLAERRRQSAHTLSGGEQVMLSIAKVIMLRPRLLLLDEPSLGLSPRMIELVYQKVTELAGQGLTTMIVEQNVRKALAVADHVVVLVLGNLRYQGDAARLEREVDLGRLFVEGMG